MMGLVDESLRALLNVSVAASKGGTRQSITAGQLMTKARNASVYIAVATLWGVELSLQIFLSLNGRALELGALAYWTPKIGLIIGQVSLAPIWLVFGGGSWFFRSGVLSFGVVATLALLPIDPSFRWDNFDDWFIEMGIGWRSAVLTFVFAAFIKWRGVGITQPSSGEPANDVVVQLWDVARWIVISCVLAYAWTRTNQPTQMPFLVWVGWPIGFAVQGLTLAWTLLRTTHPLARTIDWLYTAPAMALACTWFGGDDRPISVFMILAAWLAQSIILWCVRYEGYRFAKNDGSFVLPHLTEKSKY